MKKNILIILFGFLVICAYSTTTVSLLQNGTRLSIVTKTANYTATLSDYSILCDATGGSVTVTLPAAASSLNQIYVIKKIDSSGNSVVVDGNASETIDGATTKSTTSQYTSYTVHCNGTAWYIE